MVTVIGLCGCTCSGKSTLSKLLVQECTRNSIYEETVVIEQDTFYKEDGDIHIEVEGYKNWDCPEAINMTAFSEEVQKQYTSLSKSGRRSLLIVEGFLLYGTCPKVDDIFSVKFWLDIDERTCKSRRLERDEWLRDNERYFDIVIWPGYVAYTQLLASTNAVLHKLDATEQPSSILTSVLAVLA